MKMLLSKGKLPELKSVDFDMCESCILGKQKNVRFLKTGRTPKTPSGDFQVTIPETPLLS